MSRRGVRHSSSDIRAAIKLMESLGKTVTAIKYHPDGTFRVMTSEHLTKAENNPANSFDAWKAKKSDSAPKRT